MDNNLYVIEETHKIINILNLLSKSNTMLNLRNLLTEYNGRIKDILHNQFIFVPNIKILELQKQIQFSFFYLDKYHYFDSELVEVTKKNLILKIPDKIYIHFRRRDKRYKIGKHDISCNLKIINIKGQERETRKIKKLFNNIELVYNELENDNPNFSKIVKLIADNNKNFCNDFKIIMPIHNLQNKLLIPFLMDNQKPLLISSTLDREAYLEQIKDENVLSLNSYINFLADTGNKNITEEINKLIHFYKDNSIYSILYIPLIVLGKVIGVLRIANTYLRKIKISLSDVNYFSSVAEILDELIIKNKLNSLDDASLQIAVKDISVMGIGIEIADNMFSAILKQNIKLKVILNFNNKPWFHFIGTVRRINKLDKGNLIGILINEILPENKGKLINYINNHFLKVI